MTPLRPVWISRGSLVEVARKLVRPPCAARYARRSRAVEVGDHPARERRAGPGCSSASPERLSTSTIPIAACPAHALDLRDERAAAARDERDRALQRAGGSEREARRRSGRPGRRAEVPVDGLCRPCRRSCRRRRASAAERPRRSGPVKLNANGTCCRLAGAPGPVTASSLAEDVGVRDRGDARSRPGALPGEPTEPRPKSSRSLPAEITGTTPAAATLCDRLDQRVVGRVGLGAAAGEVDHVHPVAHGRLEGGDDLGRVGV